MQWSPHFRRFMLVAMLTASPGLPIVTLVLLWPKLRDHCMQTALDGLTGPSIWWPESWRQELSILKTMREPVTLEFIETPLDDVMDFLHDYMGVRFQLDSVGMKQAGIERDHPVTIHLEHISMSSALKVLLDQLDLKCRIQDGAICVTPCQPREKTMPNMAAAQPGSGPEQKIYKVLQAEVTLVFVETPIDDVIDFLRDYTDVNIVYDRKRLDPQGFDPGTLVTIRVEEIPLSDALPVLLEPLDATYRVSDEVLWITVKTGHDASKL